MECMGAHAVGIVQMGVDMVELRGKVAFITGGASGIGFGMARAFLKAGMRVIIADVSESHLEDAAAQLKTGAGEYSSIKLDVTDREAMASAADAAELAFGKIHVLCNNAGIGLSAPMTSATYSDWDRMLGINLYGVINGIVTFMPRIRAHGEGGHIVNTSSMAGVLALPDAGGVYSTSKFAVRGLSESLRLALAQYGVGVSVLCPGLTRTRILEETQTAAKSGDLDELSAGFADAQQFAMDPLTVGEAVLEGIRRNDAYILPHGEFIDEVRQMQAEILASFRTDLPMHPQRAAFEDSRRRMIEDIKAATRKS